MKTEYYIVQTNGITRAYNSKGMISATTLGIEESLHSIWVLNGCNKNHLYYIDEDLKVLVKEREKEII